MIMEYNLSMQIAAILPVMAFRIKCSIFPWTSLALIEEIGGSWKIDKINRKCKGRERVRVHLSKR